MELQEKRNVVNLIVSIVVFGIYSLVFYNNYETWGLDASDIFYFYGIFFVGMVIVNVVSQIIGMIIFSIISAAVNEIQGNDQEDIDFKEDERDKVIQLKSNQISMYVFIAGVGFAFISQLFHLNNHFFFIILFGFGFLSDIASNLKSICYYRRGV